MKATRKNLADKQALSVVACSRAEKLVYGNILAYVPIGSELSTLPLIELLRKRSDVAVYVPHTVGTVIVPRKLVKLDKPNGTGNLPDDCYGEPLGAEKLHFCITPRLGFNDAGYRLGYGKGCYDMFFAENDCIKIGMAFEAQRIYFSPESNDIPLDCCVTEQKVIYF